MSKEHKIAYFFLVAFLLIFYGLNQLQRKQLSAYIESNSADLKQVWPTALKCVSPPYISDWSSFSLIDATL